MLIVRQQLPDLCVATALSLVLLLPSMQRSPAAAASTLLLAVALLNSASPESSTLLPFLQHHAPLPPLAHLVKTAAA
jgi:hypothetical protein